MKEQTINDGTRCKIQQGLKDPVNQSIHAHISKAGTMKPAQEYPISQEGRGSGNRKTKSKPMAKNADEKIN